MIAMNERELALLEKLIETNNGLINAMEAIAESQFLIAQALTASQIVVAIAPPDDGPQTLQ